MTSEKGFQQNLKVGTEAEVRLGLLLQQQGFEVAQIGGARLPVDLLVWKKATACWIQLKYLSCLPKYFCVKRKDMIWWRECEELSKRCVLLILESEGKYYQLPWKRLRLAKKSPAIKILEENVITELPLFKIKQYNYILRKKLNVY